MSYDKRKEAFSAARSREEGLDLGLRAYMLKVYNYMFFGLIITGVVAYIASTSLPLMQLLHGGFAWVLFIGMLIMAFTLPMKIFKMQVATAQLLFWLFAVMMGLSTSYIFLVYTDASIVRTFFICAAMFGAMSLYGYTTKKDLSKMGSYLFMGLIGLIIASVVNIFMQSNMMAFILSILGVLIFTGLTAYDTQKIKEIYYGGDSQEVTQKKALLGAFSLYLDFINLFLFLLRLLGDRR